MTNYPQANDEMVALVWAVMQRHIGRDRRIERETLTFAVFRKVSQSYDRKLRDALSQLPIVWDDGYFIPTSKEEAEGYIASNLSRIRNLGRKNWIIERYLRQQAEPVQVEQMKLEV